MSAEGVEVSYDASVFSHYVLRGVTVTDDPVLQPVITVAHAGGFSLSVWGNMDLGDANGYSGEFNEVDFILAYGSGNDTLNWELGFIEYLFPGGFGASTREVYLTLGLETLLSPTVTVYYDFEVIDDYYANFGVEYGGDLSPTWSWTLAATAGLAGEKFAGFSGGLDAGLHDGNLSLAFDYGGERWRFGTLVAYSDSLDDDVLVEQPVDFWGGVSVGLSF